MLICLVTLEVSRGKDRRTWRGTPACRDWDALEAAKKRDGWTVLSHRREFVERSQDGERKDAVELAA